MGALGVGAEGGARISLFLLLRCYSVTKSWKPLQEAAFRCNRIGNAALVAALQNHRPRLLHAIFGRFAGKILKKTNVIPDRCNAVRNKTCNRRELNRVECFRRLARDIAHVVQLPPVEAPCTHTPPYP